MVEIEIDNRSGAGVDEQAAASFAQIVLDGEGVAEGELGLSFVVGKDGRDVERLATLDLPLGLGSEWSEVHTGLEPGESLLMVSDGVLERWGGSLEELMDAIRVLRSDQSIESPQQLAEILCKGPDGASMPDDDATAVMFHREGSRS